MKLSEAIDTIPNGGVWWNAESRKTFMKAAKKMIGAGIDLEETIGILGDLCRAVADEYGA